MIALLLWSGAAGAAEITVAAGSSIQDALLVAVPGDVITIEAGTYAEHLQSVIDASADFPITLKAAEGARVVIGAGGTALTLSHPGYIVDGLVFDGLYGAAPVVLLEDRAADAQLLNSEVLQGGRSCVQIGAVDNVTLADTVIHHCLWWEDGAEEAHGIVAGAVQGLTLRGVEVHSFSGSGLLLDPDRSATGWTGLVIEDSTFWLAPLSTAENGFPAGVVPGKNAVETRTAEGVSRATVAVSRTTAYGFTNGTTDVTAAFYWKEGVDVTMDAVTVYDSAVAIRARGEDATRPDSAWVSVRNSVFHDVDVAFRYEDDVERFQVWANTLGSGVAVPFAGVSAEAAGLDVQNLLVLGSALPAEAPSTAGNLVAVATDFASVATHDYHLVEGAAAIDAGLELPLVTTDLDGEARPQGAGFDVGADERAAEDTGGADDGGDTNPPADDTALDTGEGKEPGLSAAMRAGETGGCHCSTTGAAGGGWLGLLGLLALRRRRA